MKRIGLLFFLMLGLGGAGCLPSFLQSDAKPPQVVMAPPPPPAVTEDAVTEQNASDCARALRAEIEHDLARPKAPAVPAAPASGKK